MFDRIAVSGERADRLQLLYTVKDSHEPCGQLDREDVAVHRPTVLEEDGGERRLHGEAHFRLGRRGTQAARATFEHAVVGENIDDIAKGRALVRNGREACVDTFAEP